MAYEENVIWLFSPSLVVLLLGICLLLVHLWHEASRFSARSQGHPLPPGPPGLPIVGNLLDRPNPSAPWLSYRDLSRKYGEMVYLKIMGKSMLVINDHKIACDLLEKRSSIYSSRPPLSIIPLSGWDWEFAFMPYGQWWRRHRRVFWQYYHPAAVTLYQPHQEEGAHRLLVRLLKSPENLKVHLRYALCASICRTAHGLPVAEENDRNMAVFYKAMDSAELLVAGSTLVDIFPFLAKFPTWLPGTGFLRRLAEDRDAALLLRESPWLQAKEAISVGKGRTSIASAMLERISRMNADADLKVEEEDIAMSAAAMAYSAGLDTQYAHIQSLFVALSLHPDVQRKAQSELDAVIGPSRLPTFDDRDSLPYVNAIVKELLRWHTSTPLGVAHYSTVDDMYDGYFIPAETTILVNAWSILHDPENYVRPDEFMPERYLKEGKLDPDAKDPAAILFGFGRRICPGRYFVDGTLFIFVACVLHTFEITAPLDVNGRPIHVAPQPTAGLVSYVDDWRCTVKPRSASAETLVQRCGVELDRSIDSDD